MTAPADMAGRWRHATGVVAVSIDDETVVYEPGSGSLHLLDPVASTVWAGMDGTISTERLAQLLAMHFDESLDRVRADVADLVRNLCAQGLLSRAG